MIPAALGWELNPKWHTWEDHYVLNLSFLFSTSVWAPLLPVFYDCCVIVFVQVSVLLVLLLLLLLLLWLLLLCWVLAQLVQSQFSREWHHSSVDRCVPMPYMALVHSFLILGQCKVISWRVNYLKCRQWSRWSWLRSDKRIRDLIIGTRRTILKRSWISAGPYLPEIRYADPGHFCMNEKGFIERSMVSMIQRSIHWHRKTWTGYACDVAIHLHSLWKSGVPRWDKEIFFPMLVNGNM